MKRYAYAALITAACLSTEALAEDKVTLETTKIKANHELPKILYIVPWKDIKTSTDKTQKLVLHDFFGDLYDPVLVDSPALKAVNSIDNKATRLATDSKKTRDGQH